MTDCKKKRKEKKKTRDKELKKTKHYSLRLVNRYGTLMNQKKKRKKKKKKKEKKRKEAARKQMKNGKYRVTMTIREAGKIIKQKGKEIKK